MSDTQLSTLVINKLTKEQYANIATPSNEELYFITNEDAYLSADQGSNNAGKVLTVGNDGIVVPQNNTSGLPDQTGNTGKYLTTNGTDASWSNLANVAVSGEYSDLLNTPNLANVATTGEYSDLLNTPSIPSPQVNSDWNSTSGVSEILNKPTLANVATTGEYSDLLNTPTINDDYTQLLNKPEINGNVLSGNKSGSDLGFANVATSGSYTDLIDKPSLANVATTGSYDDLSNKPTIPAAQQQVDWNASSGITSIANKPTLANVATSGNYTDLTNKPTISDLVNTAQLNAINSGITSSSVSQISTNTGDIANIANLIPSAATSSNKLADKAFVNSSISNMAANYVTSDVQGDNFATYAALIAGPYYYQGQSYTLTNNDYALVEADENHSNATTRYVYNGTQWAFQYVVNNSPFSQAQLDAINSTITQNLVNTYSEHVADTNIHVTVSDKNTWSGKQDALVSGTNIKTINGNSILGSGDLTVGSGSGLPSQSGQSGKFLTTDGTDASWASLANVATSGEYSDLINAPTIPVVVQDFYVDSTTGAINCVFSSTPNNKTVHTIIGNTVINGTWSGNVFTPNTADDILNNANGFVVSVN